MSAVKQWKSAHPVDLIREQFFASTEYQRHANLMRRFAEIAARTPSLPLTIPLAKDPPRMARGWTVRYVGRLDRRDLPLMIGFYGKVRHS